jgi:predicted nucleic acid-binding protein
VEIGEMKVSTRYYFDSSVILAKLLKEKIQSMGFTQPGEWVTSDLTELECRRTLDRIRLVEKWSDKDVANSLNELTLILKVFRVVHVNIAILNIAKAPFPTVVRSLDAIHLATAKLSQCQRFCTLDQQQAIGARAIEFDVI